VPEEWAEFALEWVFAVVLAHDRDPIHENRFHISRLNSRTDKDDAMRAARELLRLAWEAYCNQ
jgi:hypothetical protein